MQEPVSLSCFVAEESFRMSGQQDRSMRSAHGVHGMSRGFPSQKALDAALPVAQARGEAMFFRQDPGTSGNLLINHAGGQVIVRIRRTRRLHCTIPEIVAQNIESLDLLRSATLSFGITREFWLWSPYGTMRFFRVEDDGLVELDRQGEPLKPLVPGSGAGKKSCGQKNPVQMIVNPVFSGKSESPETSPGTIAQSPCTSKPDHEQGRIGESDIPLSGTCDLGARGMSQSRDQPAAADETASDGGPPGKNTSPSGTGYLRNESG
jgi:hypothetical protein